MKKLRNDELSQCDRVARHVAEHTKKVVIKRHNKKAIDNLNRRLTNKILKEIELKSDESYSAGRISGAMDKNSAGSV